MDQFGGTTKAGEACIGSVLDLLGAGCCGVGSIHPL